MSLNNPINRKKHSQTQSIHQSKFDCHNENTVNSIFIQSHSISSDALNLHFPRSNFFCQCRHAFICLLRSMEKQTRTKTSCWKNGTSKKSSSFSLKLNIKTSPRFIYAIDVFIRKKKLRVENNNSLKLTSLTSKFPPASITTRNWCKIVIAVIVFLVCLLAINFHWKRHDAFNSYWRNRIYIHSCSIVLLSVPASPIPPVSTRTYFPSNEHTCDNRCTCFNLLFSIHSIRSNIQRCVVPDIR